MEPAIRHGRVVFAETFSHHWGRLSRGDVLVFRNPHDPAHVTVKRLIGLPGETVLLAEDGVTIEKDGETTRFPAGTMIGGERNGSPFRMKLGPEDYFVLGDNRSKSSDSRKFGAVQRTDMLGRVLF